MIINNKSFELGYKKAIQKALEIIKEWNIGDIVSHTCDKNSPEMWIKIVGKRLDKDKQLMYKCTYIDKDYVHGRLGWKKKFFWNSGEWLRDIDKTEELTQKLNQEKEK